MFSKTIMPQITLVPYQLLARQPFPYHFCHLIRYIKEEYKSPDTTRVKRSIIFHCL